MHASVLARRGKGSVRPISVFAQRARRSGKGIAAPRQHAAGWNRRGRVAAAAPPNWSGEHVEAAIEAVTAALEVFRSDVSPASELSPAGGADLASWDCGSVSELRTLVRLLGGDLQSGTRAAAAMSGAHGSGAVHARSMASRRDARATGPPAQTHDGSLPRHPCPGPGRVLSARNPVGTASSRIRSGIERRNERSHLRIERLHALCVRPWKIRELVCAQARPSVHFGRGT